MASARIELLDSVSHSHKGRKITRGRSQIITNAGDISYYRSQSGFRVTLLNEKGEELKKKKVEYVEKEPEVEMDEEEISDDDVDEEIENEEAEEVVEEKVKPKKKKVKVKKEMKYSLDTLKNLKKKKLIEIANDLGIALPETAKKTLIIRAIVKQQKKK